MGFSFYIIWPLALILFNSDFKNFKQILRDLFFHLAISYWVPLSQYWQNSSGDQTTHPQLSSLLNLFQFSIFTISIFCTFTFSQFYLLHFCIFTISIFCTFTFSQFYLLRFYIFQISIFSTFTFSKISIFCTFFTTTLFKTLVLLYFHQFIFSHFYIFTISTFCTFTFFKFQFFCTFSSLSQFYNSFNMNQNFVYLLLCIFSPS